MESCFSELKFSHVIISACLTKMKKEFKACLQKKSKKHEKNQNKKQIENCPVLQERNLIFPCNHKVKSVLAGRVQISPQDHTIIN